MNNNDVKSKKPRDRITDIKCQHSGILGRVLNKGVAPDSLDRRRDKFELANISDFTHPPSECLKRIHSFFVPCSICAQVIPANWSRKGVELGYRRARSGLFPIALHISNLLIKLEIVSLQTFDLYP